jgi:hypothetical protein
MSALAPQLQAKQTSDERIETDANDQLRHWNVITHKAVQTSAVRAGKPHCDRFAFLMPSMAMKYADTATISRPTANATPSIKIITIFLLLIGLWIPTERSSDHDIGRRSSQTRSSIP